jgi:chemotaxis signal transduction protein
MVASGRIPDSSAPDGRSAAQVKHVCFRMHGQDFALDIAAVRETLAVRPITRVFLTPPHFAGIINLRGDVVPVLDVALLLGLPAIVTSHDTRIVLCQYRPARAGAGPGAGPEAKPEATNDVKPEAKPKAEPRAKPRATIDPKSEARIDRTEAMSAGILVDELTELRTLDLGRLEPPPPTLPRETAALLGGVVMLDDRTPLQVLDIARLFTSDQVRVFQREAS